MPRGNRRGPLGEGPMTGRAMGYCNGHDAPGAAYGRGFAGGLGLGRRWGGAFGFGAYDGFGRGRGRGMGYGRGGAYGGYEGNYAPAFAPAYGWAPPTAEEEEAFLANQEAALKAELDRVQQARESVRDSAKRGTGEADA